MSLDVDLDRLRAADELYFAELYRRLTPRLRARTLSLGASADDVDDIVQEAWTRAFERRDRFLGRGSFEGWLWHTCRRLWFDQIRHAHRRQFVLDSVFTMHLLDPSGGSDCDAISIGLARQEITDSIDDGIVNLPGLQRQVATLRWLLGHSTEQTAAELGVAPGTVKAALYRARAKLRKRLSELHARRRVD